MTKTRLTFDERDELLNPPPAVTGLDAVIATALSRRGFLGGVITFGAGSFLLGTAGATRPAGAATDRFGFAQVAATQADTVTLPEGFAWHVVAQWGQPLWSDGADFDHATRGTAASQARAFGDNNDGMAILQRDGRVVLACNNEYTNTNIVWNNADGLPANADDVAKGMLAHGVSIAELAVQDGTWSIVPDSPLNRRITPQTPMAITGPAAGHDWLKTAADPTGTSTLGTWNNCGNGETPWGTYLTCEENFNGYFSAADEAHAVSPDLKRYGVGTKSDYHWAQIDPRFDVALHPNEPNRAGYVVEIDPFDPASTPKKRTALGRFKHENAELVIAGDGRVVVYLGDDERGEFLYRFVSAGTYAAGGSGDGLLDEGTLYVARFTPDQRGEWLALTPETTGMTLAEICIHTRQAASRVGATTMDRPEWVAANPGKVEAYVALTNNARREPGKTNAGGDAMEAVAGSPNPRNKNVYGQILRWVPDNSDHAADGFAWDLFALAGNPSVHNDAYAGSANINETNMFNSPDGMSFDATGLLWIETDGDDSNQGDFAGMGNNQMLVGDTLTGEIRRFMVGPRDAEVTGIAWTPDRQAMFVGIQHPGDAGNSTFPGGQGTTPRSAVIAITRKDGAPMA